MGRINVLDEHTSNKIAAGEVVERPSSVVKELIENSIDAGSKNITIEVADGGITLIRIIDDGTGIYKDDLKKAFLPHATSKIKDDKDLFSLHTLGFRGEALPSIAAVSKVCIKSKTSEDDFGNELKVEGGVMSSEPVKCACNNGTTIEVRDIFYNVPARKKFLKSNSRENSIINDIVNRIAISNPSISFKMISNGKKVLNTYGTGNLIDVVRAVYGKTISSNILYFESADDVLTIYGYIGKEDIARGSRNNQSIFVNGRFIKHKTVTASVENAFKSFSTVNKFPFFILFIDIYPELVDVNIHPTKAEIKFNDDRAIYKKVFDAVHSILKKDVFESFKLPEEETKTEPIVDEIRLPIDLDYASSINNKEIDTKIDYNISKDALMPHETSNSISSGSNQVEKNVENDVSKGAKFPPIRIIGQFNKTYIIGEYADELYFIDQHAAHEKILFEKYSKDIQDSSLVIQPLLLPLVLDLSLDDYSYFEENKEVFKASGFILEEFGDSSVILKEVPYFLGKTESKSLFLSILDNLKNLGSGSTLEVKYNKIASMSCKAAVKGNDNLSFEEMEALINKLRFIDDPFHCPHGRPAIIKMTNYDLEKKFRRIV